VFVYLCEHVNGMVLQALELLVEKCASSVDSNKSASSIVLRVFECMASGLLLDGSMHFTSSASFHTFTVVSVACVLAMALCLSVTSQCSVKMD